MNFFMHILFHNVIPLAVMISAGVILQKSFMLDIKTLSKLNFYLFSPVVIFKLLYESKMSFGVLSKVLLFFVIFFALLFVAVEAVMRVRRTEKQMRSAMRNSVLFYNSANFAIPLNQLVFSGNPFTLSIQIVIMMMQNLIPNTYGIYSVNSHKLQLKDIIRTIMSMPVIYAIPLAFVLRGFSVPIPESLYTPIGYVANGFIAMALVTLGVQLGSMKWSINVTDVIVSNALRLCISPAIGFIVVWMLGIEGIMAKALVLSCAVPTSLSSVLLAVEFDNEPEFASQAVFASTVFSIFTVTFVIYGLKFIG